MSVKHDQNKLRFDLIDPQFEEAVAEILTFGARKYSDNSWQDVDDAVNRYYAAVRRHMNAYRQGDPLDDESMCSHLAHAATNIMFLLYFERRKYAQTSNL